MKPLFLIDCDGVMLDYNKAFKDYYERIYNKKLELVKPNSYFATEMWGIGKMSDSDSEHFKTESSNLGLWENMPAISKSLEFVQEISKYFTVWCLTSMPTQYEKARLKNLQKLGYPIEKVIATSRLGKENPKKRFVEELNPMYFMDDLLQNFEGINSELKTELIFLDWKNEDSPNSRYNHIKPHLTVSNYEDFFSLSSYYIKKKKFIRIKLNINESPYFNHLGHMINSNCVPISPMLKEEIFCLQNKYANHSLEGDFKDENFFYFDKLVFRVKEELKDWKVDS